MPFKQNQNEMNILIKSLAVSKCTDPGSPVVVTHQLLSQETLDR